MEVDCLTGRSVLVTGGAGFIGSHLVDALLRTAIGRVTVVDNFFLGRRENLAAADGDGRLRIAEFDATDHAELARLIASEGIETVFNLAIIPLPASLERPQWSFEVNVALTLGLCELQRAGAFRWLIHFSSSEAYGSAQQTPMSEDHPLCPLTPYAASKAAADHLASSYAHTFNLPVMTIRPFNNYGPRQNMREYAGIIPTAMMRLQRGLPIAIFGDGKQTRDYIFAPDTAALTVRLANEPRAWGQTINLASGHEISMLSLVQKLADLVGTQAEIEFFPERPGDVRRHVADVQRAESLLGGPLPLTSFDVGLAVTVEWYRELLAGRRAAVPTQG